MSSPPADEADVVMASPQRKSSAAAAADTAKVAAQKRSFEEAAAASLPARSKKTKGYDTTKKEEAIKLGATLFSADGTQVICDICSGHACKSKTGATAGEYIVNLRTGRPFDLGYFFDHVKTGTHTTALANIAAEKETGTVKRQTRLFSGGFSGKSPKVIGKKVSSKKAVSEDESGKKKSVPPPPPKRTNDCAGLLNSVKGQKKGELMAIAPYVLVPPTKGFVGSTYANLPALRSPSCTGNGTHKSKVGPQCKACFDLLKQLNGTQRPGSWINTWYPTVTKALERRVKPELAVSDCFDAKRLANTQDGYWTSLGLELKEEAKALVEYMVYLRGLRSKLKLGPSKMKVVDGDAVPGTDAFLGDIAEVYETNPKFRDSLEVALIKSLITKLKTGRDNAVKEERVVNFIRLLATHSPAAAEVASANLGGPSKRWMQMLNAREMNVSLGGGADAPMTPCRYRVMGVYVKHYNKWLLVNEKQPWARHLEEAKKKKYRFVARMINKDSTGLGDCDDVDLDGGAAYNTANVLRLENGTAILDVIGKLQFQ